MEGISQIIENKYFIRFLFINKFDAIDFKRIPKQYDKKYELVPVERNRDLDVDGKQYIRIAQIKYK